MLDSRRRRVPWVFEKPPDTSDPPRPKPRTEFTKNIDGDEAEKLRKFFPVTVFEILQSDFYRTVDQQWRDLIANQVVETVYEVREGF